MIECVLVPLVTLGFFGCLPAPAPPPRAGDAERKMTPRPGEGWAGAASPLGRARAAGYLPATESATGTTAHGSWFQNRARRAYPPPCMTKLKPRFGGAFL
jgi:hypothetical protein